MENQKQDTLYLFIYLFDNGQALRAKVNGNERLQSNYMSGKMINPPKWCKMLCKSVLRSDLE